MKDFQRSRVYEWERDFLKLHPQNWRLDAMDECKTLVEKIWYGTGTTKRIPKLGDGRRRRRAVSLGGEIRLPRGGEFRNPDSDYLRTAVVICHELAHELLPRGVGHTADFVSTHLYLLNKTLDIPLCWLVKTIRERNIKYNPQKLREMSDDYSI